MNLTQLKHKFKYIKKSGKLIWKNHRNSFLIGIEAGTINSNGYKIITISRQKYSAHRLVWFLENGKFPKGQIDHINGNKLDNKISNLRDVCVRINQINTKKTRRGKLPGAHANNGFFKSSIMKNGKRIYLGTYRTEKEASERYFKELNTIIEHNTEAK